MQPSRFELKYLINEEMALKVRDFVRCYIDFDPHTLGKPNYSYPVHSLYLDSDDLRLYREAIGRIKNRYKLRLRYYDANPNPKSPVFFEIKRRMNNCVLKHRGGVRREFVGDLLSGHLPREEHLLTREDQQLLAVNRFCQLMNSIHAKPRVQVFYMREAYMSPDEELRVTIDRSLCAEKNLTSTMKAEMHHSVSGFQNMVILELKFTNRFPSWFRDLVRMANVLRCGAEKYAESIRETGSDRGN
jgi:hypothetical protein